ncbi:hypothetical protein KTE54_20525 [Burkholderia multivorans]|uniref:hypothetical protein n=1 Tax=Burkholderia multivorans TaxID=87883 RepID=UPI001C26FCEB|nr:hypothetical protein [Burkholderia multivorans]MBU9563068.1 hypothetical protein [Burkholderia multivorans]
MGNIDTDKMKALAADLRKGSSGRYKWYAMGRDETSYFMDFDWGYDADRWFSDQQKSRAAWIEQEGIHIVKKLFQTELETNASEAADAIDTLLAALEAAAADKRDAERYRWMAERFLGADFEWGRGEDGYGGIPALIIELPEKAKVWGCLDLTIDDHLSRTPASEGEQK